VHTAESIKVLTDEVKQKALQLGADVVGVAGVGRFETPSPFDEEKVPPYPPTGYAPAELLPGARSVISLGLGQLMGVMESSPGDARTTYTFGNFGYWFLNHRLDQISYDLCRWLEQRGWSSLPLGDLGSARYNEPGQREHEYLAPLHGVFSLKRAAVLAGVGRKTKATLVANPVLGTKIRLGCLITTAPLQEDLLLEDTPCPPGCKVCVEVCPTGAVLPDGRVDHIRCFSDVGRRGRTMAEARRKAIEAYPPEHADDEYSQVRSDMLGVNNVGNRLCRVACMVFCPLGERKSSSLLGRINDWKKNGPRLDLPD